MNNKEKVKIKVKIMKQLVGWWLLKSCLGTEIYLVKKTT